MYLILYYIDYLDIVLMLNRITNKTFTKYKEMLHPPLICSYIMQILYYMQILAICTSCFYGINCQNNISYKNESFTYVPTIPRHCQLVFAVFITNSKFGIFRMTFLSRKSLKINTKFCWTVFC